MALFEKFPIVESKQDYGHLGVLHDVVGTPHFGMFVFNVGENHYCHFDVILTLDYFFQQNGGSCTLGNFVFGTFDFPEEIPAQTFIDQSSLEACGFNPIQSIAVSNGDISGSSFNLSFHFVGMPRICGVLFEPADLSVLGVHFLFKIDISASYIKCWNVSGSFISSDDGYGFDESRDCLNRPEFPDAGFGWDIAKPKVFFSEFDAGLHKEDQIKLRIFGSDISQNYSMLVQHIALSERGTISELYGFNGYTERYYYPDHIRFYERVSIKKLNFMTWSGILVEYPWCALLWYGEIYFFADQEEFGQCCREHFKEHANDVCPICGKPIPGHWKYSFIDITRIPHQIYFCSLDCLHGFNRQIEAYLSRLTETNLEYLLDNGL